jgi:transcriptional antiterminator
MISLSPLVSDKLIKDFESIIEKEGVDEIQKLKLDPINFVSCIMKIHTKSTSFITQSFSNDADFITARNNVSFKFF